jgi:hypothetical protein
MIVNRNGSGWTLITQPAHAWLAGELAAGWGNAKFRAPTPFQAVTQATRLHDIGWLAWDAAPRLGGDGRPVGFIGTTLAETAPIWRRAVKHVSLLDPYAAVLVSMHASTIYRRRLERGADPPEERSALEALAADQLLVQEKIRDALVDHPLYGPEVEPDKLIIAYRWLRVCDLLSLVLCSDVMAPLGAIEAYQGSDSKEIVQIHYERPRSFEVRLDPSPFVERKIELVIQTRSLRQDTFDSQAAYLAELQKAPWAPQKVMISRE